MSDGAAPLDARRFRDTIGLFATGVAVIVARGEPRMAENTDFEPPTTQVRMCGAAAEGFDHLPTMSVMDQLRTGGAAFFRAHPGLEARLEQMKAQDPRYLAHEFLNQDWYPVMFADVAAAMREASPASSITPRCPGTVETPAAAAAFFDSILSPIAAIALTFGPMKTMPAFLSASANASRSDRKP